MYDTLNRLESLTNPQSQQFTFGYDVLSRRSLLTRPNSVNTEYAYDDQSRLLSVLHQMSGTTIDGATYTLDSVGNRTSKQNHLAAITESYAYDNIYQLTGATQGGTSVESYLYDKVGNRTSSHLSASYAVNSSNQLTATANAGFTYDNNGNTLTKTEGANITNYTWDYENRLTQVTLTGGATVSFKYDPFGRRIYKSSAAGTTIFLYDGANIVEERDGTGAVQARYTHSLGIDEPLAVLRGGVTSYYHADGLGSITSLTNTAGTIVASYRYDSYGHQLATTGTILNPFRYTAREWDGEIGLYYYRARYYDSSTGRFVSKDPIGFKAGINYYRYVRNNPVNLTDPKGLYELKGFPAAEAAQMTIAIGQLAAKLRANPCCIDPKLRDRVLDLLQPGNYGSGVTFVYQQTISASPGYITCAQLSDGWDFLTNTVTISQAALNGACGCPLPGTLLHEATHLTWKNYFGPAPETGAYGAGSACFGSNCARPAGLTTP